MRALPIVERELRRQARLGSGVWLRVAAALVSGLAAVGLLSLAVGGRIWGQAPGRVAFLAIAVVSLVFALVDGVRQTADCLSRERREGTLGLLFLTDLRGLDVVLGKLAATALPSVYALLAVLPALAMALPFGGVLPGEVGRAVLVLLGAMAIGLGAGMWASARESESGRALWKGLALAAFITAVPYPFEILLSRGPAPTLSPAVAFTMALSPGYARAPERFWLSALALPLTGVALLLLAGRHVSRGWQEEERPASLEALRAASLPQPDERRWAPEGEPVWTEDLSAYQSIRPPAVRPGRDLLDRDPGEWLAGWSPRHGFLAGLAVFLLAFGIGVEALARFVGDGGLATVVRLAGFPFTHLAPFLFLAYLAGSPIVEARREGGLELVLTTPLGPDAVVSGLERAVWSQLAGPLRAAGALTGFFLLLLGAAHLSAHGILGCLTMLGPLVLAAARTAQVFAIVRGARYFGLREKSLPRALWHTLLWALMVPGLVSLVLWAGLLTVSQELLGLPSGFLNRGVAPLLDLAATAYFVALALRFGGVLRRDFRELASAGIRGA